MNPADAPTIVDGRYPLDPALASGYRPPARRIRLASGRLLHVHSAGDTVPGGYNGCFVAFDATTDAFVSRLDYQSAGDDVLLAMVETAPEARHEGAATTLLLRLLAEIPTAVIDPGLFLDAAGAGWWAQARRLLPSPAATGESSHG